jgi:hypothetical protein
VVAVDVAEEEGLKQTAAINHKHGAGIVTFFKCDVTKSDEIKSEFSFSK